MKNLGMRSVNQRNTNGHSIHGETSYERLIESLLEKIQIELMPAKAKMVVAINVETGEYALGEDSRQAGASFKERWPNTGYYMCRVDGSPSGRM